LSFKGVKTDDILETEMFSILNRIMKRDFYTPKDQDEMKSELMDLCIEYLQDLKARPTHP